MIEVFAKTSFMMKRSKLIFFWFRFANEGEQEYQKYDFNINIIVFLKEKSELFDYKLVL